jgi:hypothetical protein
MVLEVLLELVLVLAPFSRLSVHAQTIRLPQVQTDRLPVHHASANRRFFVVAAENPVVFCPSAVVTSGVFQFLRLEVLPALAVLLVGHVFVGGDGQHDAQQEQFPERKCQRSLQDKKFGCSHGVECENIADHFFIYNKFVKWIDGRREVFVGGI